MITLVNILPEIKSPSAEYLKIKCLFDSYKDDKDVLFWSQDEGRAYISMADGDMVISNNGGNTEELREFISVLLPRTIFADCETLNALGYGDFERVNVVSRRCDALSNAVGDSLSSREIYDILNFEEFSLPEYPFFAVDFCRRLNRGGLNYYAVKNKAAAVTVCSGEYALLNGIVSHEKGKGTEALNAVMGKNKGRIILAVCRDGVMDFYIKNGFERLYGAGYQWIKR